MKGSGDPRMYKVYYSSDDQSIFPATPTYVNDAQSNDGENIRYSKSSYVSDMHSDEDEYLRHKKIDENTNYRIQKDNSKEPKPPSSIYGTK